MRSQNNSAIGTGSGGLLSGDEYRAIFRLWPDLFCVADTDGVLVDVNPACECILGYAPQEMIGKTWDTFLHPDDLARTRREVSKQLQGQQVLSFVNRYRTKSSAYRFIQWQGMATVSKYLIGIGRDITEEVRRSELLAKVAQDERNSVSAALHDGISQQLFGLRMIANQVRRALEKEGSELAPRARTMEQVAHDTLQSVRNVMEGLEPCGKNADGFATILQNYAKRIGDLYNVRCTCEIESGVIAFNHDIANQLCLIIQEAVINAVKHASASRICISMKAYNGSVNLSVADDGKGINENQNLTGYGISIMRDRAALIGADLYIAPSASGGTMVSCIWNKPQE